MRNVTFGTLVLTGLSIALATPAFGNSTVNTIIHGTETGTSKVKVNQVRVENGSRHSVNINQKLDAVTDRGGTANVSGTAINGSFEFRGNASTNQVDPFLNGGFSKTTENATFTDTLNVDAVTKTQFDNSITKFQLDTSF